MLTPERIPCRSAFVAGLLFTLVFLAVSPAYAQCEQTELVKLTAATAGPEDLFGSAVVALGEVAVVGSPRSLTGNPGFATVLRFDGAAWQQEQALTASDGVGENQFGFSVDVNYLNSELTIIVGAPTAESERGAVYAYQFDGASWVEVAKLVAADGEPGDRFGVSVGLSRTSYSGAGHWTIIVGAEGDDEAGDHAGAAYLFDGVSWSLLQKLIGSATAAGDDFGSSVCISRYEAVVGAPFADDPQDNAGAAYVFHFDEGAAVWFETEKLTLPEATGNERFGFATSTRGAQIAVGAPGDDTAGPDHGAVYLYKYLPWGYSLWDVVTPNEGEPSSWFGGAVSFSRGTGPGSLFLLAVGAFLEDAAAANSGKAYVYVVVESPGQERQLLASDGGPGDLLGGSVAAWSTPSSAGVLVGAPREDGNGTNSGAAYSFPFHPTILSSPGDQVRCWGEAAHVTAEVVGAGPFSYHWFVNGDSVGTGEWFAVTPQTVGTWRARVRDCSGGESWSDPFELTLETGFCPWRCGTEVFEFSGGGLHGWSVALDGDHALVGAYGVSPLAGKALLHRREGETWTLEGELGPGHSQVGDGYGKVVAIDAGVAIIGAPLDDGLGNQTGAAWIYPEIPLTDPFLKLVGSDTIAGDQFGAAVGLAGDVALVGAPLHGTGAVYVFRNQSGNWIEKQKLVGSDVGSDVAFGKSIALSGNLAFIGVPGSTDGGAAYVFRFDGVSWVEEQRLTIPDPDILSLAPTLSYSGGVLALTSRRLNSPTEFIHLFQFDGSSWLETQRLESSDGARFDSVAVGANVIVAGASNAFGVFPNHLGAVYVFRFDGSTWWEADKWFSGQPNPGFWGDFGFSTAVDGDLVMVGDPRKVWPSGDEGASYIFDLTDGGPLQDGDFDDPTGASWCLTREGLDGDVDFSGGLATVRGGDDGFTISETTYTYIEQTVSLTAPGEHVLAFLWSFTTDDAPGSDGPFYDIVDYFTGQSIFGGPVLLAGGSGGSGVEETYISVPGTYRVRFGTYSADNLNGAGVSTFDTVTIIDPCPQLSNLTCTSVGDDVTLSWNNPGGLTMIHVSHDGFLFTTLPADATGFTHAGAPLGSHTYEVFGVCGDVPSAVECTIDHAGCVAPVITTQPIGVSACVGEAFALAVAVTGVAPISYQWQRDDVPIPGATLASYSVAAATQDDAGSYLVTVTDACGVTVSSAATVGVGMNCLTAYDLDLDSGETSVLVPGGGAPDPLQVAYAEITSTSSSNDATAFVTKSDGVSDPSSADFVVFGDTVQVITSLADGEFFLRVLIPFTSTDLGGASPMDVAVLYHDGETWRLAVEGNTAASPGHAGSFGDRFEVQGGVLPVLSSDLGDHGVFYDPTVDAGFGWANVDFAGDFALGIQIMALPSALAAALNAPDAAPGDLFGHAVAIDGVSVLVGVFRDDDAGSNTGSAHLYRHNGTSWTHEQKINGTDSAANDFFGSAVALTGDTAVVGAFQHDCLAPYAGAAYVYRYNGAAWFEEQKLTASDGQAGDLFGNSAAASGSVVVVGAYKDDNTATDAGAVYVFRHDGTSWIEEQKLTALGGSASDQFGWSVAVLGDEIVVGARLHDGGGTNSGAVYFFRHDGVSWVQEQKLLSTAGDQLGYAVSLEGNRLVGGAPFHGTGGAAFTYQRSGSSWVEESTLLGSTPGDAFGLIVDVDGCLLAVGALTDVGGLVDAGSVGVFELTGSSWLPVLELTASIPGAGDRFGSALSLSGGHLAIGAPGDDDVGSDAGTVSIFE